MEKIVLKIEGMKCGHCEAHMNEAIRDDFGIKKAVSSHDKGTTEFVAKIHLTDEQLRNSVKEAGYKLVGIERAPYEKKFWEFWK